MPSALIRVQKFFPEVTHVQDSKTPQVVTVTKQDNRSGKAKSHQKCALALACKRLFHADGAVIALSAAYIVKGKVATRFKLPESAAREIVAFDRKVGFTPGEYKLSPPQHDRPLGVSHTDKPRPAKGTGKKQVLRHVTRGVRTSLSSV
jgi:hypothetical protein